MSVAESDESLIARAQAGDREAFEGLVLRTSRLVFARLMLDVRDPEKAEDLVQETYLAAFRSIRKLKESGQFRPWLLSIAYGVMVDSFRREKRKKRWGPAVRDAEVERLPSRAPSPGEDAERVELRQKALSALLSLPEEYRLPLALRYLAGADYDTIGRQLGLTNGSLRGMLGRGMALLRSELRSLTEEG